MAGKFVISLDFELMWGVRDKRSLDDYGENILGVWQVLPQMIDSFEKYNVKATFATVGFLFATSKDDLLHFCPEKFPEYNDLNLSPYNGYFNTVNESNYKFHFASELIDLIKRYPNQEIATHTFSHYYCLERGQNQENFKQDILAAIQIAKQKEIEIKSLVFPRNQFNDEYLEVIESSGITSYRGNERSWIYNAANGEGEKLLRRVFRFMDAYINISGHHSYSLDELRLKRPYDIPSSRFLRPYSKRLKILERLRLRRILDSMTYAAKRSEVFHLWWHPHNFGLNQKENMVFLSNILAHYIELNNKFGFESVTMKKLAEILSKE